MKITQSESAMPRLLLALAILTIFLWSLMFVTHNKYREDAQASPSGYGVDEIHYPMPPGTPEQGR